ncbi:CinA family protein [Simiduia sp. 21SJ11W-1]|uniref:CinA family protein n=1 Tax=Simiduia sp. 21SJ11W-1 TaxID=2909669 RepID=UPI0020A21AE7|nr:CinA family protein [Simiduia sp. 21SJ11W-1]UTA49196.1 CinA family protein [Simiduia sp. 21SJ11W-1]
MTHPLTSYVDTIAQALTQLGQTVSTAESCTGGGLAQALTAVAGSSAWFEYGWVTYANAAKVSQLGVEAKALAEQGAVSEAVALQMAAGAAKAAASNWAVATTGIAGPGGGTANKPVGTVWIAWYEGQKATAEHYLFEGSREKVRVQAVEAALSGLAERLKKSTV